jgi:hypothetical protein|tara:strand:- start:60 stop:356 length:297 start_codon:yes stop_codon:yes gene_type:complete
MAASATDLRLIQGEIPGYCTYRYDTTDAATAVDADGYFNNGDDDLNLAVGDVIMVVIWATAVLTGTVTDVSLHVVQTDASGVIDLSDDMLAATVTSGD